MKYASGTDQENGLKFSSLASEEKLQVLFYQNPIKWKFLK